MKTQNFERELPEGYRQIRYLNAKNFKLGLILNAIALGVCVVVMLLAAIPLVSNEISLFEAGNSSWRSAYLGFLVAILAYIILHEVVHGIAYKALTGEKLTFGLSWSCAFCGVPHIYTYRKTAMIAVTSPLLLFTAILLPLTVFLYFVNPVYYILSALLLGLHLGGCGGDIYVLFLLMKYKNKKILMRDTGPEQFFYLPEDKDTL